jgi:tryptophan synthase beta chain
MPAQPGPRDTQRSQPVLGRVAAEADRGFGCQAASPASSRYGSQPAGVTVIGTAESERDEHSHPDSQTACSRERARMHEYRRAVPGPQLQSLAGKNHQKPTDEQWRTDDRQAHSETQPSRSRRACPHRPTIACRPHRRNRSARDCPAGRGRQVTGNLRPDRCWPAPAVPGPVPSCRDALSDTVAIIRSDASGTTRGVHTMDRQVKYVLQESEMPRQWYNVIADLPSPPPPPLHPGTRQPVGPDDLAPLFPAALIAQEVSPERHITIPDDVLDVYRLWRPTPLFRARRLEKDLGTPARIYYKYEGGSPAGSHKPNTAVPQAYYNAAEGVAKLTTETGAGQWGSALSFACALFGLDLEVWMVRASYDQKPYRKLLMETYGATVHASPSEVTSAGRAVLAEHPDSTGSLGIAISEAVEVAGGDPDARYALGSVLNHVLLHQTVIGEEAIKQLALAGDTPDVVVGCTGGGSNFGGLAFPFLREKLAGRMNPVIRAVEPAACPSFTRGVYAYDFGDTAGFTPLLKMHTLGHEFIPDPIHAGGLRYHGMSPLLSHIYELGLIEAVAKPQSECFAAGLRFARTEGIVPAPEPTHAVAACIEEALRCKETGEEKVILTALCGHGLLDLAAYGDYVASELTDLELPESVIAAALAGLPAGA